MRESEYMVSTGEHADLGGYLTGSLDDAQRRLVERHLSECAECRGEVESLKIWTDALTAVPSAAQLDGPPEDGDLLLQRTLRQIRSDSGRQRRRGNALLATAAAVVVAAALSGGALIGMAVDDPAPTATVTAAAPTPPTAAPGTKFATATDAATGARITVAVAPAAGWVRVNAAMSGIPAGENCRLLVVARDGSTVLAGSWRVSEKGAADGTTLDGSALVDPGDVTAVRVENTDGRTFAAVNL